MSLGSCLRNFAVFLIFPLFFRQRLVAKSTIETALSLTRLLVHFMSLNAFTPQVTIDEI